jgi:uncharacterized protein YecT (DUF1311 family)
MMRPLCLSIVVVTSALQLAACGDTGVQEETAAAMARDSSLAHDLKLASADTAPFSDAADVAVAPRSDTTVRMVDSIPKSRSSSARVVSNSSNTTVTESPGSLGTPVPVSKSARASVDSFAGPSCASPAMPDQRRCLLTYLSRSDVTLDRNYQALIAALKREAGPTPAGREPATVLRLRTAQRNWLVYRDDECRRRNEGKEGPLWAPTRAECLAEYSGQRAQELANALAARSTHASNTTTPSASNTTTPSASKSTKPKSTKRTKHTVKRTKHHRR